MRRWWRRGSRATNESSRDLTVVAVSWYQALQVFLHHPVRYLHVPANEDRVAQDLPADVVAVLRDLVPDDDTVPGRAEEVGQAASVVQP